MEFVTSQKNKNQNLVHEGYIYNHHKDNKDGSKKTYRCQKRYSKRCPGTATVEGDIVTAKGAHNHLPNIEEIEKRKTLKQIYDHGLQSSREAPKSIFNENIGQLSSEAAARMPKYSSIQQNIARKRKNNGVERKMETSLHDLTVQDDLKKLENGEEFLLFDSGNDDDNRIIIFSTEENLKFLKNVKTISVDGTFYVCPAVFKQMWCIHGMINGQQIALVYCFLPDQKTETYKRVIQKILEFDATIFDDKIIICDFEKAEHNAFKELFANCIIRGCYFHFTQAIWKNVEKYHLQQLYLHGKNLKKKKKKSGYTYRRREKNPRYAIDIWNVHETTMNGEPRTNNQAELWHGHLKDTVRIQYPPFYTIAKELQKQHANSNVLRNQIATGMVFNKKKIHADKDARVLNVVRNFNIENVLDFLKNVNIAASVE